ncbi:hypothetical protein R6242_18765 [Iodobacter sp. CM08]|uniref:hypothetical protein n=1 Tax=Iodobacter sp. CM08 TaxID=3085902 RepID=UPI0029824C37|nr:hypothetical protein [Iodobacter sp. CM08]MDW5418611.1 hypothetical protein [Iodobacter sp. CM08]
MAKLPTAADAIDLALVLGEAENLPFTDKMVLVRARNVLQYRETGLVSIKRWRELEDGAYLRRATAVINTIQADSYRIKSLAKELKMIFHMNCLDGASPQASMEAVNRFCRRIEDYSAKSRQ